MTNTFPDDENGDVLRRMAASGMDLTVPCKIDFFHFFAEKEAAIRMARKADSLGYEVESVSVNEERGGFDVTIVATFVPTHQAISEFELTLDGIARELGGKADGWGVLQEH